MVATVYATDGTLAKDVPVDFSVDFAGATLDPVRPLTNSLGRATTTLTSPRPPGDTLTVTARLDAGTQASRAMPFPALPYFVFGPLNSAPYLGDEVSIDAGTFSPCNISGLSAEVTYDPSILEFEPDRVFELGVLNGAGSGGTPSSTTVDLDYSAPGRLAFHYFRNDNRGVSISGSYIRFSFRTLNPGNAKLTVLAARLSTSVGADYDLYPAGLANHVTVGSLFVQKPSR
jgi:hypothetical protein